MCSARNTGNIVWWWLADEIDALRSQVATLNAERDEAREWVRRMHREHQTVTCVYCGHAYPPGTPASGSAALTEHIAQCPKHPMAAIRADLARVTAERDAALADAGDLAAECKAWREAWEGRDHASDGDADPAHSHDRPGRWDDGRECASCCRFMRASAARGETDESGALYRHGGGA